VENQAFMFDGPIVLDINNLVIRGCSLIFRNLKPTDYAITVSCGGLLMESFYIDCGGTGTAIRA
jgi:hypothetical protein